MSGPNDSLQPVYLPGREPVTVRIDRFVVGNRPIEQVHVSYYTDGWFVCPAKGGDGRLVPFADDREAADAALVVAADLVKLLRAHREAQSKMAGELEAWERGEQP